MYVKPYSEENFKRIGECPFKIIFWANLATSSKKTYVISPHLYVAAQKVVSLKSVRNYNSTIFVNSCKTNYQFESKLSFLSCIIFQLSGNIVQFGF